MQAERVKTSASAAKGGVLRSRNYEFERMQPGVGANANRRRKYLRETKR